MQHVVVRRRTYSLNNVASIQRTISHAETLIMRAITAVLLLATASVAGAEDFSYNYLNLGYGVIEFDDVDADGDALGIDGAFAVAENFHLFAMYELGDFDFDIESTAYNLGIGYNQPVSETVDVVARLSYEYFEVDAPLFGSADDSGYGLGVGLRFSPSEQFELNGGIDYVDFGDSGDDTGFNAAALYNFTEAFSVTLRGEWTDDVSSYTLGGRFYFGG